MKDGQFCSNTASTTFFSGEENSFQKVLDKTNYEMLREKVSELQCMLSAAINDQNELKDKQHKLVLALQKIREKCKLRIDRKSPEHAWYRTSRRKPFFKEELNLSNEMSGDHCDNSSKNQFQVNLDSRQSYFTKEELKMHSSPERSSEGFNLSKNQTSRFSPSQISDNQLKKTMKKIRGTSALKSFNNLIYKTNVPSTSITTIEQIWKEVPPSKAKCIKEDSKIGSFLQ